MYSHFTSISTLLTYGLCALITIREFIIFPLISDSKCYIDHHGDRLIAIKSSADNPNLHLYWSDPINKTPESVPTYPKTETFSAHPNDFGVIHELEAFDRGIVVYHSTLDESGNR